jgi:tRNA threonylcarbamoyladenosine biosynthesis protein TsaB
MRVLGIETATWTAGVGLVVDGEIVAERSRHAERGTHAVSLLPLVEDVLAAGACTVDDLDVVAVSCGPGSFTGLRVGLSVAKGLACAAGARLVGVPTLEALAKTAADRRGHICAALDARRGEVYAACFVAGPDGWRRLTADTLTTAGELVASLPASGVVIGDAVDAYGDLFRERLGAGVTLLPFDSHGPRGGVVAMLGWERARSGDFDDLHALEPFYIRPSDAEINSVRD